MVMIGAFYRKGQQRLNALPFQRFNESLRWSYNEENGGAPR